MTCNDCKETWDFARECPDKDVIAAAIAKNKRTILPCLLAAPTILSTAAGAMLHMDHNDSFVVDISSALHNVFDQTIIHDFKPLEPGLRGILMANGISPFWAREESTLM
jgi:hypothetical protein